MVQKKTVRSGILVRDVTRCGLVDHKECVMIVLMVKLLLLLPQTIRSVLCCMDTNWRALTNQLVQPRRLLKCPQLIVFFKSNLLPYCRCAQVGDKYFWPNLFCVL
jgi:hypothetical protein